jgi:GT2 family glycosyltransferase
MPEQFTLAVYTTGPEPSALQLLRYGAAARALGWQVLTGKEGIDSVHPELVEQADAVLLQRDFPRFYPAYRQVLAAARAAGKPVLYDVDDLLLALPPEHPNRRVYEDCLGGMTHALLSADTVIVSTAPLQAMLRHLNPRISLWPTVLPDTLWRLKSPQPPASADAPFVIGYMGGASHLPDIELLTPLLLRILAEWGEAVQVRFWGCLPPAALAGHPQVWTHPGAEHYADFAAQFASASADVWLAPLVDNPFNRCKSAIKFWEYSAIGGAGIYSRLEPYTAVVRHGENGLLAGSLDEWEAALRELAADPPKRLHLAQNAQADLRQRGLLSHHLEAWQTIYQSARPVAASPDEQQQVLLRLAAQVQQRSDERHHEAVGLLAAIAEREAQVANRDGQIASLNRQIETLTHRSNQLDDILQSRTWRALLRMGKLRRFDFSPLPPFEPFRLAQPEQPAGTFPADLTPPTPSHPPVQFTGELRYQHPPGVQVEHLAGRTLLTTTQGGKVTVDERMAAVWQAAHQHTLDEVLQALADGHTPADALRAALACLAEAGLLQREGVAQPPKANIELAPQPALVSVVIVGYKSREWLDECIPSLRAQSHQALEIIFVENGPPDGSREYLAEHAPEVVFLALPPGSSLAKAMNAGAFRATGDFILQLNPDVRLEPDAIAQMVAVAQGAPQVAAVGCKLKFWWAPAFLNGLGNHVGPFSWGSDNALGHLDLGQFDSWRELPSACFAATLITRAAWQAVGPIDEGFPMYYEDSEWCYRARLLGWHVLAAPQAVVYHAFGGRVPTGHEEGLTPFKLRNVVYGRMRFTHKIPAEMFNRFARTYRAEDWANVTHALLRGQWDTVRAYGQAWADLRRQKADFAALRGDLQRRRVIDDAALFGLQHDLPMTHAWRGLPELTWDLTLHHYLPLIRTQRTRPMPEFDPAQRRPHLLIISNDVIAAHMAGPGMRYLEMALALKDEIDVTLAAPAVSDLRIPGLNVVFYAENNPAGLQVLVENCDVALISGYMVEKFPFLLTTPTRLVVDLYDPFILENLHYYLNEPMGNQQAINAQAVAITNRLLQIGDFFLCGNLRQRDLWLGALAANGRVNPQTFADDTRLQKLIDVVGVGFPAQPPHAEKPILRGVHPLIPADARIVLWGGGIWNWLDPLTLVRAWPAVLAQHPEARLVFLGTRHPNPDVPRHEIVDKTIALAEQIGEKDKSILFIEWVAYHERQSLLLEADVGVTLHPVHVETRYSARTRILDYFWARLPVLITEGDMSGEWVQEYGLGGIAPEGDAAGVAAALNALLDQPKAAFAAAFEPLMARFAWPVVVQPLLHYCRTGKLAPDRLDRRAPVDAASPAGPSPLERSRLVRALYIWRTEGTRAVLHRVWRYVQWRMAR